MVDMISLAGVPDNHQALVLENSGNIANIKVVFFGTNDLSDLIDTKKLSSRMITLGGSNPEQFETGQTKLILNTISDADSNRNALNLANQLVEKTDNQVINHPNNILKTTRDRIYQLFKDIEGITVPKTIRIAPRRLRDIEQALSDGEIELPVIFREAGSHNGLKTCLLETMDRLHDLEQFAFDGRDFYLTEFFDYRSSDGLYRKVRFFVIDGVVYPRHLIVSRDWNIHANSRKDLMEGNSKYELEDQQFLFGMDSQILHRVRTIYHALKLDFFGIDCNISEDNSLLIFEINASMRPFASSSPAVAYMQWTRDMIREAINEMVTKRISRI